MNQISMIKYNSWIVSFHPVITPRLRIFCFPYAGGNALAYKEWGDYFPEDIEVCCIQLPGRGNRFSEQPISSIPLIMDGLSKDFLEFSGDVPFVFFGHSMGALLTFEFTQYLKKHYQMEPEALFVSAHRAPYLPRKDNSIYYNLPDAELMLRLKELNGTPDWFFEEPELVKLSLPTIKADLELCECYFYQEHPILNIPIHAFGGTRDPEISEDSIKAWERHTMSDFQMKLLPGDHFFIHSSEELLVPEIYKAMRKIILSSVKQS
ncbi:thioesterase II family protein [Paenibacillus xylanexedens]|uniref:thioesterase II family protein n=1 Tax=Paenibacillus xylanexedens TaxID=528191 RepID=UPI00119CBC72|nr:alpha/beta fold hydrolase [Paenibacillus xylanexedens]